MAKKVKKQKLVEKIVVEENKTPKFKFFKKILLKVLIVLLVVGVFYFGKKYLFVASVNGRLVSRLSVIKDLERQGGQKVLDTIVLKTLINQEAKKRKMSISDKELEAELTKIEVNVTSQGTTLEALLLQQGMTKDDLASEIKLQLLVTKMVDNNISVTDKEVEDYLAGQKSQLSLDPTQPAPELTKDQAKAAIRQQKLQGKIQSFVADLKAKAKISYFIKY